jgi:transposase
MGKPYSLDLRERVIAEVEAGASVRAAAETFAVSPSFVVKLSQAWRRTGSLAAKPQGGDQRSAPVEAHADWLLAQIAASPDLTLAELREGLRQRGLAVATSSVWRFFARHDISFKKNGARGRAGAAGRRGGTGRLAEDATLA